MINRYEFEKYLFNKYNCQPGHATDSTFWGQAKSLSPLRKYQSIFSCFFLYSGS